jgi:hypothetical protein
MTLLDKFMTVSILVFSTWCGRTVNRHSGGEQQGDFLGER